MRQRKVFFLLAVMLLMLPSCRRKAVENRPTIPYVRSILADRTSREMSVLKSSPAPVVQADISYIGPSVAADRFAELFSAYDRRDNVDGSFKQDGLPDFAGETLDCISDDSLAVSSTDSSYISFLRERVVRDALCALDTALHISPYDIEGLGSKNRSKLIVLGTPAVARNGAFDVDTLFRSTGCGIPMFSPIEIAFERVLSRDGRRLMNVGVIYDPRISSDRDYQELFARACRKHGHSGSLCFTLPSGDRDSLIFHLLDEYVDSGHGGVLDAVIIDDMYVDPDEVKNELARVVSVMNESSMTYGRLISKDFEVESSFEQTAEAMYDYFRRYNLFTHNIAKPQLQTYRPVPRPEADDASVILIPGSYVQN